MPYELWMSLRYLFTKRRERFVSVVGFIAMSGVALGCGALIVVIAVMNGFGDELRSRILGTSMHLVVEGSEGIPYPTALEEQIAQVEHVVGVAPYILGESVLRTEDRAIGVLVRGIDPFAEVKVSMLNEQLHGQIWELTPSHILVGKELASVLGVRRDDELSLIAPTDGKRYHVTIGGIFDAGHYEYDVRLAYMHLQLAQQIFGIDGRITGFGIRLDDLDVAEQVATDVARILPPIFGVRTWMDMNASFFTALKMEKMMMFIILTLIVLVAAANIVSTLLMMVMERMKDIGVLKSIGASNRSIWLIFTCEGVLIGCLGVLSGVAIGVGICWIQHTYGVVRLPPSISSVYQQDVFPIQLLWMDVIYIAGSALLISLVATVYPAWQASKLQPVEALRYE